MPILVRFVIFNRPTTNTWIDSLHLFRLFNLSSLKKRKLSLIMQYTKRSSVVTNINHCGIVITKTRSGIGFVGWNRKYTEKTICPYSSSINGYFLNTVFVINTTIHTHCCGKIWCFLNICFKLNVTSTGQN